MYRACFHSTFRVTVPYILSTATFELKMYGTVTINVPQKQGFGVYQIGKYKIRHILTKNTNITGSDGIGPQRSK